MWKLRCKCPLAFRGKRLSCTLDCEHQPSKVLEISRQQLDGGFKKKKKCCSPLVILVRKRFGPLLPSFRRPTCFNSTGQYREYQPSNSGALEARHGWYMLPCTALALCDLTFALPFDLICMKGLLTQAISQPVDTRRKSEGDHIRTRGSRDHARPKEEQSWKRRESNK